MQIGSTTQTQPMQMPAAGARPGSAEGGEDPSFKQVWSQIQAQMGEKPQVIKNHKKTLDKDDFLKIMIAQMQHQDPTKPFEAEKLAAEVAQITSVEQLSNVNKTLERMSNQSKPLERMAMTNLIGKTVEVDRGRFPHIEGANESLSYSLTEDAGKVRVSVLAESGETILSKELGPMQKGQHSFNWDGVNDSAVPAKSGGYALKIEAATSDGRTIRTQTKFKSKVIGVGFDQGQPILLVKGVSQSERVPMDLVTQIESDEVASAPVFDPGVGSKPAEESSVPPEVIQQALAQMQQNTAAPPEPAPQAPPVVTEKGFPNGLGIYNQPEPTKGGEQSNHE